MVQNINNLDGRQGNQRLNSLSGNIRQGGRIRGDSLRLQASGSSITQQAAEEASFFASERMQKPLRAVKFENRNPIGRLLGKGLVEFFGKFPDYREQAQSIINQLKQQKYPNSQALMQRLKNLTPDPNLRFLVLASLIEGGQKGSQQFFGGTAHLGAWERVLHEELRRLWKESGKKIQASLNISKAVQAFLENGQLGQAEDLRALYHDAVLNYGGLEETFEQLVKKYGYGKFQASIDFLLAALGEDLRSSSRSVAKEKLQVVVDDMHKLKTLTVLFEKFKGILISLKLKAIEQADSAFKKMMDTFIYVKSHNWSATDRLNNLMIGLGLSNLSDEIYFLREFRDALRHLPLKAFADDSSRIQLLGVLQEVIDERVALEEEDEV